MYEGSCHCGRVRFELDSTIEFAIDCNCSLCRRKGGLWHPAPNEALRIVSGENELTLYQFNTKRARHYFCRHCGVHPFSHPRLDPTRWSVNVRCIDGLDLSALRMVPFDGSNWEKAAESFAVAKPLPLAESD